MKKLLAVLLSVCLLGGVVASFAGCGSEKVKLLDVTLSEERYGFCVGDDNSSIMTAVNELIEDLCGESPYDPNAVEPGKGAEGVKYDYNGDGTAETVTFDTLYTAEEEEKGTTVKGVSTDIPSGKTREDCLVVATNAEFAPFEYFSGNDFAGIDMHIAKMLANKLGKELVIKHMVFDSVITSVSTGESDIGMAGLTISEGREQNVTFSDAYYYTAQRVAVLESDTTFDDCKTEEEFIEKVNSLGKVDAGAATGQTGYWYIVGSEDFGYDGFKDVNAQPFETVALAVKNLSNGKIKFVIGDSDPLRMAVEETNEYI
ncbi:MAG TPA: transporter substrate-binding domain-containing protein [Candidatus Protoclostridium stercorigallinarum]|uniref:Transporter substrate-binding domain-containing protein n=1 Tax=Candidatus Protoclostridium stercorigallinarum TaxID=2838741 RepID=A0A9D1PY40_9FIRM|nr:transporter substrate-binding domain-containing protein [Candidatus Protoclostridium stercorigallinarum]